MFRYPARLKADEAGFTATFRDIPEAITAGETREEAIGWPPTRWLPQWISTSKISVRFQTSNR